MRGQCNQCGITIRHGDTCSAMACLRQAQVNEQVAQKFRPDRFEAPAKPEPVKEGTP